MLLVSSKISLLALIQLLAISVAIFSAFDDLQIKLQTSIFENFVSQISKITSQNLDVFTKKIGKLTAGGIM